MQFGIKWKAEVKNLVELKHKIEYLEILKTMSTDKQLQIEMQKKCLQAVRQIANERLAIFHTSNEDMKTAYLNNNKVREVSNGFIIYNDLTIEKPQTKHSKGYTFSVALAFEYGTGLIGEAQAIPNAWTYNMNQNTVIVDGEEIDGWWLATNKAGSTEIFGISKHGNAVVTRGYEGMEIYRYAAEYIKKNINSWIMKYAGKNGGASQ